MGCNWRRCYKLVSLLHTNRAGEFFLYGGLRVKAGEEHEAPLLYAPVKEFVLYHGRGVLKRLILDRRSSMERKSALQIYLQKKTARIADRSVAVVCGASHPAVSKIPIRLAGLTGT